MDLRMELIKCVREAQAATEKATVEFNRITDTYNLTEDGKEEQAQKIYGDAQTVAVAARNAGFAAIDAKIRELDAQEQSRIAARMADTEYQTRLETKLRMIAELKVDEMPDDILKAYFAEFADDPIATNAVENLFAGSLRGAKIAPIDTTGRRQEHLNSVVRAAFERACNRAGAELLPAYDLATGAIFGHKSEIEGFIAYCQAQNDDFSLDDVSTWESVRGRDDPETANVSFGFNFKSVR